MVDRAPYPLRPGLDGELFMRRIYVMQELSATLGRHLNQFFYAPNLMSSQFGTAQLSSTSKSVSNILPYLWQLDSVHEKFAV